MFEVRWRGDGGQETGGHEPVGVDEIVLPTAECAADGDELGGYEEGNEGEEEDAFSHVILDPGAVAEEFEAVRSVAPRYREVSLLLAHSGCVKEDEYIRVAADFPNVYLDPTFSGSPRGLIGRFVDAVGAGKVVWGSDVYFFSQTQQIGKVLGADIADEDKVMILSRNAQRILDRIVR